MARSFNGTTDQIDCGAGVPSPTPNSGVTLGGWFNTTSLALTYESAYARINGVHASHQILVKSTGHIAYYVGADNATPASVDPGTNAVTTNAWNHTLLTSNTGNSNNLDISAFLNGVADGTGSPGTSYGVTGFGTSHTSIGVDLNTAGRNFSGSLAHWALWNIQLSAGEILALAKGALPYTIRPANLLHYMPLDGLQSPEPDLSGFANNGTLTGTALAFGPPVMQFTPRWPQFLVPEAAPVALMVTGYRRTILRPQWDPMMWGWNP